MKGHRMATKNPRINVTFEESVASLLAQLAMQKDQSVSSLVRELALEALERREDFYFSRLAEERDKAGAPTYSHEEAWK